MGKLFFQDVFATRISELTGFDVPYGLSCDDLDVGDALKLKIQDIKFLVSKNSENEITVCTKIKKLGDGALNNVYCAIETKYRPNSSPSRPCLIALKKPSYKNNRISDPQTTDKEFQENFKHDIKKEIRYARACASPLSPHRVSTTDTKIYMHSTLMCSDLCTFVYDHLPASLRSAFAIEVLKQILPQLKSCHANGIAHRDIKLANILMRHKIVLADYGIAYNKLDAPAEQYIASYVAPEGLMPNEIACAGLDRADIYALGMALLFIVSGAAGLRFEKLRMDALNAGKVADIITALILLYDHSISTELHNDALAYRIYQAHQACLNAISNKELQALIQGMMHYDPAYRLSLEACSNYLAKLHITQTEQSALKVCMLQFSQQKAEEIVDGIGDVSVIRNIFAQYGYKKWNEFFKAKIPGRYFNLKKKLQRLRT